MRCAIVEYNYYHGETLPTLVYILNRLDIDVDIFASPRLIRFDPFTYTAGLRYRLRKTTGLWFKLRVARRRFRDYEFVVLNSTEPKEILQRAQTLGIPTVGVMHNGHLVNADSDYRRFFAASRRTPLVLARHAAAHCSQVNVVSWIAPVFLGRVEPKQVHERGPVRFCVQGNVEFDRRNYGSLLDAIERLASDGGEGFQVMVVGRNGGSDGQALKTQLRNRKLEHLVTFSEGEIAYHAYYGSIAEATYLLPLVDTTSESLMAYYRDKLTSSIPIAIGFGVVPIIHQRLARLYQIDECSITYADGGLCDALRRAMSLDDQTLAEMRAGLAKRREALLTESAQNLRSTLQDLGLVLPELTAVRTESAHRSGGGPPAARL